MNAGMGGSPGMNMNNQPYGQGNTTQRRRSSPLIVAIVVVACCLLALCIGIIVLVSQGIIDIGSWF